MIVKQTITLDAFIFFSQKQFRTVFLHNHEKNI